MTTTKEFERRIKIQRGLLIRQRRIELGKTQRQLAAEVDPLLSDSSVGQWEIGSTTPRLRYQRAVAKALDLPWADLFGFDDEDVA